MVKTAPKLRFIDEDAARLALPELSPLVATILFGRGIMDPSEAQKFLEPDYIAHSHDPFLMKGMKEGVERVLAAITHNERITIFTDYDCDGIPGGIMWHDFFTKIKYENFEIYIPHRHDEGFGLNMESLEGFAKKGTKLLITLDCGITDTEEVAKANELGLEVIITDHHLPAQAGLPPALVIINPKQEGCVYPEKMLCGSGVAFKFIQGIIIEGNKQNVFDVGAGWEKWLLDMAGIATLSDMVPLMGENRVLASFGLRVLRKSPRVGLQKLLSALKVKQHTLNEEDVGFSIAPRINVASRMSTPREAFTLLSTLDVGEAGLLVEHLEALNSERKGVVAAIVKDIKRQLRDNESLSLLPVLVFGHTHWKPAVLGLAANSIMRETGKPVFVWGREGGELIKGSCRSNGSVSVVDLMHSSAQDTFVDFGGHQMSGGFSISTDNIHALADNLNLAHAALVAQFVSDEVVVDKRLIPEQVGRELWKEIARCAPYGTGNPKPLFLFEHIFISEKKFFGKAKEHVELRLRGESGKEVAAIQFFAAEDPKFALLAPGSRANILAHMEESLFKGYPEYRLRIVDVI